MFTLCEEHIWYVSPCGPKVDYLETGNTPMCDNTMSYQETTHLKVPVILKHSLPNVFDNIDENISYELI